MAVDHHRAGIRTQPIHALPDNPVRLPHFFNAHQITVVTIAVHADRNVEVKLIVHFIRLFPAQSHSTPEPRSIGPVKPSCSARSGDTAPMPTKRCFQIRLSVSNVSYSSTQVGKR